MEVSGNFGLYHQYLLMACSILARRIAQSRYGRLHRGNWCGNSRFVVEATFCGDLFFGSSLLVDILPVEIVCFQGHGHWVNTLALSTEYVLRTGAFDHNKKEYSRPEDMKEVLQYPVPSDFCKNSFNQVVPSLSPWVNWVLWCRLLL